MKVDSAEVVLELFRTVERRDRDALVALEHPDVEFHWPPSLPYGGIARGRGGELQLGPGRELWMSTWDPFQPTEAERCMDPRVIAAMKDEVVVLWHQRAIDSAGERLDEPVLALYEVRDGLLARGQMFYFDPVAVGQYLQRAKQRAAGTLKGGGVTRFG